MRGPAIPTAANLGISLEMLERVGVEGEDTLILAFTYRCNSRCRFCIIETEIDQRLPDTDAQVVDAVLRWNAELPPPRRLTRLTLSGAEATLRPDLADVAHAATTRGGFDVVRIQTNGRRLSKPALARDLVAAGVGEYFVSMHAADAAADAKITGSTRGFAEMQRGVRNVVGLGARALGNTVVCADNAGSLPDIVRMQIDLGVSEVHLWSFLHIGESGQGAHLVDIHTAAPAVCAALDIAEAAGVPATVKWFPRCQLGRHGHRLNNHQPQMLIRDTFQQRLSDGFGFGCAHASRCRWFGHGCDGLHEGYVRRFGDEADHLHPESP